MQFSYDIYFKDDCILECCVFLFSLVAGIAAVVSIIKEFRTKHFRSIQYVLIEILKDIMIVGIVANMLAVSFIPLMRGGIHLLYEKERDAVEITGEIEEVYDLPFYGGGKYYDENHVHRGYGKVLVIDGTKYYFMYGDFNKGDTVSIKVLPKSKKILEIELANL